jgi:hypothetical protein
VVWILLWSPQSFIVKHCAPVCVGR